MDETLQNFLSSIDAAAWKEIEDMAESVAADHEGKLDQVRTQVEREAESRRQAELSGIARDGRLSVDARRAENRRKLLALREECADRAAETLRARVEDFTASADYPAHLADLLKKGLAALGEPPRATVRLRREDMALAESLLGTVPGTALTAAEGDFALGGLILEAPELGRRADLSFDAGFHSALERFGEFFGLEI